MRRLISKFVAVAAFALVPASLDAGMEYFQDASGLTIYHRTTPLSSFKVKVLGDIAFAPGTKDVAAISPGGYLSIEKRELLRWKKIVYDTDENGAVQRTYLVGGNVREIDTGIEIWIRETLLEAYYLTGLGAQSRARELVAQGASMDVILREAERLESNEGRYYYLKALTGSDLSLGDKTEVIAASGEIISSSHRLGLLLMEWVDELDLTPAISLAMFKAAREISSSYERSRTLVALAGFVPIDRQSGSQLVRALEGISSSYESAKAMLGVAPFLTGNPEVLSELLAIIPSISSSHEKKKVITAVAVLPDLKAAHFASLATAAGAISSSYESSTALQVLADEGPAADVFVEAYLDAATRISSSYELARTLIALSAMDSLSPGQGVALLQIAGSISSSSETGRVLQDFARRPALSEAEYLAYLGIVASISSSHEQGKAMLAILDNRPLPDKVVREAVSVAQSINSSSTRGKVLDRLLNRL